MLCLLQEPIAASDEYGKDLEHVEVLQKKFDDFQKVYDIPCILHAEQYP